VEHNLHVVARLADRITVLQRGAILTEGDYASVSADPRVREAYLGVADDEPATPVAAVGVHSTVVAGAPA
jgi:branched-chain amino acid transport system ATP-binding protein